jgi:tetratricopeptide (TPR) repeat protein
MTSPELASATVIEAAAAQLGTEPAAAALAAERILIEAPGDPRALLILASARRRLGEFADAKAVLEPLAQAYPNAAKTQFELGLVLAAMGDTPAGLAALRRAVAINRDESEALRALGDLLFREGDIEGSQAAYAAHRVAIIVEPELKAAALAQGAGRLDEASARLVGYLSRHRDDAMALRMLGEVRLRQGLYPDAERLLERSIALDPRHAGARFSYADALFKRQKAAEALAQIEPLLEQSPDDPAYLNLAAACLGLIGEDARVIAIYDRMLVEYAKQPRLWLNYGHALRSVGRRHDAVAAYGRCLELSPSLGDAYWSLANLKVAAFAEDQVAAMRAQLGRPDLSDEDRLHLHYALGKALEDLGDDGPAFENYAEGARIRRGQVAYDTAATTTHTERSMTLFTPAFFADRAGWGDPDPAPIFIVGLPRSGSTLIEQILASHSAVEGTMELPHVGLIANDLIVQGGPAYPAVVAGLDQAAATKLGQAYVDATRIYRRLARPRFIDKMPNNFQHIGLIHLMLPNARIIDARRHPMATCFSAFKQHFAQGQSFSYDLDDLGRYYRDYVALMDHFDAALPGRVHRVVYEDMVENTEAEIRRLLDHCGLPFEAGCLSFHKNTRAVRTVSSEQVRRPIFRDGLEQWRRFETDLAPLIAALGPSLRTWRGAAGDDSPR